VLGLIALRTRSLLPGFFFHALYNGTELMRSRAGAAVNETPVLNWFVTAVSKDSQPATLGYTTLSLVVGIIVSAVSIAWFLVDRPGEKVAQGTPEGPITLDAESALRKPKPVLPTQTMN
jgi:hypothetical protein